MPNLPGRMNRPARKNTQSSGRTVRLYYLGGLPADGKNEDGEKVRLVPITSKGRVFYLPDPGDYLEVPVDVARDLMRRHKVSTADGTYSAFTDNRRLAESVKSGMGIGAANHQAVRNAVISQLTEDEIIAILEQRRGQAVDDSEDDDDEEEMPKVVVQKAKPAAVKSKAVPKKKGGRPKKNTAPALDPVDFASFEGFDSDLEVIGNGSNSNE